MSSTADILIIGGGLMGCSTAFHLATAGITATVIERNSQPGRETTARSGAIIRAHYGVPELVVLANQANRRYVQFEEEVGYSCGFVRSGYVVIVDDADSNTLKANVALHAELAVDVELMTPEQIGDIAPSIKTGDIALGAYERWGGYADPAQTVAAYVRRAEELGANFRYGSPVASALQHADGWDVTLENGDRLSGNQVVLTTGNWSRGVGRLFGVDLPVTPVRAQIVVVDRPGGASPMPVVSDLINLAYFRSDGQDGMWVGSSDMADLQEAIAAPEGFEESAGHEAISAAFNKTTKRFQCPSASPPRVQRSFAGLYETTPDWQPIIDQFPNNLHVAVGFSGHGFKLAPVIGEVMAAQAAGIPPPFDVSLFRLSRYAEDRPIKSRHTYRRARFLR